MTPYGNGIAPPTSTLAWAVATDQDNTVLTRVPVYFSITFSTINTTDPARIGVGNPSLGIVSNTFFTVRPTTFGMPTAAYAVICGGTGTGASTIYATINLISCALTGCTMLGSQVHSTQPLTTGGPPSTRGADAGAAVARLRRHEHVDAHGARHGLARQRRGGRRAGELQRRGARHRQPSQHRDKERASPTSVITPLFNSGAGVTVVVTAGDSGIAAPVQQFDAA